MTIPQGEALFERRWCRCPSNLGSTAERWTLQRWSVLSRVSARHGDGFPLAGWDCVGNTVIPPVKYVKTFQVGHDSCVAFHLESLYKAQFPSWVATTFVEHLGKYWFEHFEALGSGNLQSEAWFGKPLRIWSHWQCFPNVACLGMWNLQKN